VAIDTNGDYFGRGSGSVLTVIRQMHEIPFNAGAERVSTSVRIDDRRDKDASMVQKMQAVQDKLVEL